MIRIHNNVKGCLRQAGFSLVEVTLALGIVAFALVVLIGVLGTAIDADGSVSERREGIQAVDALHHFIANYPFDENDPKYEVSEHEDNTIYDWAQIPIPDPPDDPTETANLQELAYVTFRSDEMGEPSSAGNEFSSTWLVVEDDMEFSDFDSYEDVREGTWIKIRLRYAKGPDTDGPSGPDFGGPNPMNQGDLPPDAVDYEHAYVVFNVEVFEVAIPTQNLANAPLMFTTTIVARR